MALTGWKAFPFFEASEVQLDQRKDNPLDDISSICTGSNNVFVGCNDGSVRILSRSFKVIRTFEAHETGSITHMKQIDGTALLVTVSEDLTQEPILKVWALDKLDKKTGVPRCQCTLTIQNGRKQFPISAFAAVENLSQVAVGFANGAVTLIRGDLIHDRGTKQRTVFESDEPITGIQFREGNTTALCIATTARFLQLIIAGRGQGQPARVLDDKGASVDCVTVDQNTRDVIVGRDDAIYYYAAKGKVSAYSCDGQKTLITTHKDYVAVVSLSSTNSISKSTLMNMPTGKQIDSPQNSTLLILNTDFYFVAHRETIQSPIKHSFVEWGDLFLVTLDGKILRYHEKPLQKKLDMLYERNLHVLAIQMAQKAGVDKAQQNALRRKYGDYLYNQNEYDMAMQQYLTAIDNTEPSRIIRKYLDTQRIKNLIAYLEELHEHRKANSDHTILLLNCYAKTKDTDKLATFIQETEDANIDLDMAISMCRQGGYPDQAAYLARKHEEHDLVVTILIEDSKKYEEALAYIWRLEPSLTYHNLSKYGSVLLEHCPEDATQLFVDYYTGAFRPKKDAIIVSSAPTNQDRSITTSAVQSLASLIPLPHMSLDSSERPGSKDEKTHTRVVESQTEEPPADYAVPKPRGAFSAFLDHPQEFMRFLEALVQTEKVDQEDKADIYKTLFEMYLRMAKEGAASEKSEWEKKAMKLLEHQDIPIDSIDVLLLSDLEEFKNGSILVREQQGLRFDIFRSYTQAKDTSGAIKALKRYGPNEPQLYPAALAYFTSSPHILEEAGIEFENVLRRIEEDRLMAPLQVIQTLSTNGVATLGLVKKYLQNTVDREQDEISKNHKMMSTFQSDSNAKRTELERLKTESQTLKATRCSSCGSPLDHPSVHYMCEHSYHQRCLNIGEGESVETVECPKCAPQNANIRAIKRAQEDSKDRHDLFKDQLGKTRDRFGTIAEWFGRGVMSVPNAE